MPFQLVNVKRTTGYGYATFDLVLYEQGSEITLHNCALMRGEPGASTISLKESAMNASVVAAITAKVALAL